VELIIDLRQSASATQKVVAGENGGARLEVDFPAGDYPPVPGLFEPSAAKGRSHESDEPDPSETPPGRGGSPPAASSDSACTGSPPADGTRAAPSAPSPSTPPAR
jgi:hypothetical protein